MQHRSPCKKKQYYSKQTLNLTELNCNRISAHLSRALFMSLSSGCYGIYQNSRAIQVWTCSILFVQLHDRTVDTYLGWSNRQLRTLGCNDSIHHPAPAHNAPPRKSRFDMAVNEWKSIMVMSSAPL